MIYFIAQDKMDFVKIGRVADGKIQSRLTTLQTGNPELLHLLGAIPGDKKEEADLHHTYRKHRYRGEWFCYTGDLKQYIEEIQTIPIDSLLNDAAFMAIHTKVAAAVHPTT